MTADILVKTSLVLRHDYVGITDEHAYFRKDNPEEVSSRFTFVIPRQIYNEMGEPQIITVTVEIGDHLNKEP